MYKRKTRDRWDIETNYGYGWEVENCEYTREDAKRSYREYRENMGGRCDVRMTKHREPIKEGELPSADRPTGEWIDMTESSKDVPKYRCSACGYDSFSAVRYRYCPNCGARMEGGEE